MVIVEYDDKLLPEIIRERRLDLQMTQTELAREADISIAALRNYEQGCQTPSIQILRKIMHGLKVDEVRITP